MKEKLAQEIYSYLRYDQLGDTRFHNPFEGGDEQRKSTMKDSYALADIAMKYINKKELV